MDKAPDSRDNEAKPVCKLVRYLGRVQGGGFRDTAHELASSFPITGYVRNLPNGSVELVAEGMPEQVHAFLAALGHRMAKYIQQTVVQEQPCQGHSGFRIRS